jgi:hypothetical protein
MANNSRIRFNPVTKEIEVEGTEQFVKIYFGKLQAMISGSAEKKAVIKKAPGKKKITNQASVIELIQGSKKGISTGELTKKTGLAERQIWSIVYRATKEGKIRKIKRGTYGAVAKS